MSEYYVLDACALIAFLNDEAGADVVEELLRKSNRQEPNLFLHRLNLLEVYYGIYREVGPEISEQVLEKIQALPVKPGLKVVFCGTAAGNRSATIGAYYAGRGNQFWAVLHRIGLTPRQLQPQEYRSLLSYGIGLTDLVKRVSGNDNTLEKEFFDIGGFQQRLVKAAPKAVAFNGKRAAMEFLGRHVKYGLQPERLGSSAVFVLPSTSGAARAYWNEQYWLELAEYVGRYDKQGHYISPE